VATRKIETEITGDASSFTRAAGDAAQASDELRSTWDQLQDEQSELARSIDNLAEKVDDLDGVSEAADAFGNMERVLNGVNDGLTVMAEQFGVNIGPMGEYVGAAAQVAGGMEGIIAGGSELVGQVGRFAPALAPAIAGTWGYVAALTAQAAAFIAANAPMIAIIATIALVAAGVILLITHWDTINEKVPILGQTVTAVVGVVTPAFDLVVGAFQKVLDFVSNNWPIIASLVLLPFAPIILVATDAFGIRSAALEGFEAIGGFFRSNWPELVALIALPFAPLVLLATDGFGVRSKLIDVMTNLPGDILSALGDLSGVLLNAGYELINGLWDGVKGQFASFMADFRSMISSIPGEAKGLLKIFSPSEVMAEIGEEIARGLIAGIERATPELDPSIAGLVGEIKENMDGRIVAWINGLGDDVRMQLKGVLEGIDFGSYGLTLYEDMSVGSGYKPSAAYMAEGGSYVMGSDGRWYESEAAMPAGVTGASSTPSGNIASYIGADQTRALPTAPKVGDTFNGMVWTGSYWSQGGAGYIPTDYTGYTGGNASPVIQTVVMLDGAVIAEAVNKENGRAY
jgi:hypothetical protein